MIYFNVGRQNLKELFDLINDLIRKIDRVEKGQVYLSERIESLFFKQIENVPFSEFLTHEEAKKQVDPSVLKEMAKETGSILGVRMEDGTLAGKMNFEYQIKTKNPDKIIKKI